MVNLVAAQKLLLHCLMKMAGVVPHALEVEPGTVMNVWVPSETIAKPKSSKKTESTNESSGRESLRRTMATKHTKPVVVLVHGFAADGIMTWQFQVGSLTKKYSVYVPDLLFFGGSITDKPDRSPTFQAHNLVRCLKKLGIEICTVVGFSYGGMVAFKMAELYPDLVEALVISGSNLAITDSVSAKMLNVLGFSSFSEFLLPESVKGCKALLKVGAYKKFRFPDRFYKDFLEVMFNNRKERAELLEGLVVSMKDATIPSFHQRIHLLWGEKDQIFNLDFANNLKQQLGDKASLQGIEKAGHLVHLERPCLFNKYLNQFLASLHADQVMK